MAPAEIARDLRILLTTQLGPAAAPRIRRLKALPAATRIHTILEAMPKTTRARIELPFVLHRVASPAVPGFVAAFASCLTDPEPWMRERAAQVLTIRPRWAALLVAPLAAMVAIDLHRQRGIVGLGTALRALAAAQTREAEGALLALERARFGNPAYRVHWLHALATYRSPRTTRVLKTFEHSRDLELRTAALCGLVRNGVRRAVASLRTLLDVEPVDRALRVAWHAHFALRVTLAVTEERLAKLRAWWDRYPEKVERLFRAATKR